MVVEAFEKGLGPWLLPSPAVTEIAYLLGKFRGQDALADFLEALPESSLLVVEPETEDYRRSAEVIRQYQDAPLDFVDAVIVAIAERLETKMILTVDRRHFHLVRPKHCEAFEVYPS